MNSLVSIIIPVYNVEVYLKESVSSVCKQTYENLEIILVNDGSTDDSGKLCDQLSCMDKRIKVIHKQNGGQSSARNIGLNNATGDYILFIDSDDFIESDTVRTLLQGFCMYENIGIVSAPCFYSYENGKLSIYNKTWEINTERIILHTNFCIDTLIQKSCHSACCKLYRKELFSNLRFREGKRNEDTLFMFDLSFIMNDMCLNMLEIPQKFYFYRVNEDSTTHDTQKPIHIDIIENLLLMHNEKCSKEIKQILKKLYYKELVGYYSFLVTNPIIQETIDITSLQKIKSLFLSIDSCKIIKESSFIIVLKYYLIRYFKPLYIWIYKIKIK